MTETSLAPRADQIPTVRDLRHRAEVPTLVAAGVMTVVGLCVAAWAALGGIAIPAWASAALIGLATPFIAGLAIIRFTYWKEIADAVEITPTQLPEVHAAYVEIAEAMGIEKLPRLYLKNGNGGLNAFASKCQIRRAYVVIFSDLLDIAYEHGDLDGVRFVLAHELGHIHCGHVDLWRLAIMAVPRALFVGRTVTRAQEYTADRCAARFAPEGATSMMALFAGKRMYQKVDLDAYFDSVENHKDGFWLRFANFWADHAVGFRRMQPLRNIEATGWDVHGRMF